MTTPPKPDGYNARRNRARAICLAETIAEKADRMARHQAPTEATAEAIKAAAWEIVAKLREMPEAKEE